MWYLWDFMWNGFKDFYIEILSIRFSKNAEMRSLLWIFHDEFGTAIDLFFSHVYDSETRNQ